MFWKRKPITHALALWSMVIAAAVILAMGAAYVWLQFGVETERISVHPPKKENLNVTQPTLFGKVVAIEEGMIRVESEQPYDVILIDEETEFSAVAGGPFDRADLNVGALISATGKEQGDRTILADAVAVIQN